MAAYERRPAPLFGCPDAYQVDVPKGRMVGRTPANKLVQATESVGNQVRMPMIVFVVIERNSHDGASGHLGDRTARGQMVTESTLGDHNVNSRLRQYPDRAGNAQQKGNAQSLQNDCLE